MSFYKFIDNNLAKLFLKKMPLNFAFWVKNTLELSKVLKKRP